MDTLMTRLGFFIILSSLLSLSACADDSEQSDDTPSSTITPDDDSNSDISAVDMDSNQTPPSSNQTPPASNQTPPASNQTSNPGPQFELPACADDRLSLNAPWQGTTAGAGDNFGPAGCADGGTEGSEEIVLAFQAPEAGPYIFDTAGSSFDTVLQLRKSCTGDVQYCNDDASGNERTSLIRVELEAGEVVIVAVDGFNRESGATVINVSGVEQSCSDAQDNDGDNNTDCNDLDCYLTEGCEGPEVWPAQWVTFEEKMLEAVNVRRAEGAECGPYEGEPARQFNPVEPLSMDTILRHAARLHSQDMAVQNYFEHRSLDGRSPFQRMEDIGFMGPLPWGENLAAGSTTAQQAVNGLMDSPGHCRNIMDPSFLVVGIGYAMDEDAEMTHYWTQKFAAGH